MQEKIILPNSFISIAEEELKAGKSIKLLADGASMYPFIRGGKDIVEIHPINGNEPLQKGEIYLFNNKGRYNIHRLIGEDNGKFVMMGDGNRGVVEKVGKNDVIGIVRRIHRDGGTVIDCSSSLWKAKSRIWVVMRPVRRYLLAAIRRLYRYGIIR